jgi:hypothetical protein
MLIAQPASEPQHNNTRVLISTLSLPRARANTTACVSEGEKEQARAFARDKASKASACASRRATSQPRGGVYESIAASSPSRARSPAKKCKTARATLQSARHKGTPRNLHRLSFLAAAAHTQSLDAERDGGQARRGDAMQRGLNAGRAVGR